MPEKTTRRGGRRDGLFPEIPVTEEIRAYIQCGRCADEVQTAQAAGLPASHREYARLNVGMTPRGLQVWCVRHEINVTHLIIDWDARKLKSAGWSVPPPVPALDDIDLPKEVVVEHEVRDPREMTDAELQRAIAYTEGMGAIAMDQTMNLRRYARYRHPEFAEPPADRQRPAD